jgi:hypothetical protein
VDVTLPGRIARAWRGLPREQRLAAGAALALFATLFLPWYQLTVRTARGLDSQTLTAFADFSFIEAAVCLVAVAVLVLLFVRAERRGFHLPGGDGTVILVAGAWTMLLLVWRAFDKPGDGTIGAVGLEWGFVFAFGAAGVLAYAGFLMRAAHRPEPPLPAAAPPPGPAPRDAPTAPTVAADAPTAPTVAADPPAPPTGAAREPPPRRSRVRPAARTEEDTQLTMPLAGDRRPAGDPDLTRSHGSEEPLPRDELTADLTQEQRERE